MKPRLRNTPITLFYNQNFVYLLRSPGDPQILQDPMLNLVHPSMHPQRLLALSLPSIYDGPCLTHLLHLRFHILFDQEWDASIGEFRLEVGCKLGEGSQPAAKGGIVGRWWRVLSSVEAGDGTPALGMTNDNDMLDFNLFDSVSQYRKSAIIIQVELAYERNMINKA